MNIWVDVATIIASLATFGALIAVIYEIRKSRNIEMRQATFELNEKWEGMVEDRRILLAMKWESAEDFFTKYGYPESEKFKSPTREWYAYSSVANFFETIGQAIFHGLLDWELTFSMSYGVALSNWQMLRDIVYARRKDIGEDVFIYFEWFALQSKKVGPSMGKNILAETALLREEVHI